MPGLGLRLDRKWDVRNQSFPLAQIVEADEALLPNSGRWLTGTAAFNQGDTGTCVGQAGEAFLVLPPVTQKRAGKPPTRWDLYRACVMVDEWGGNDHERELPDGHVGLAFGTSTHALMQVLQTMGWIGSYRWAFGVETVSKFLRMQGKNFQGNLGGPVVVGTIWKPSMFNPTAEGFLRVDRHDETAGGHCWILVGANRNRGVLRMRNSWGTDWGRKGEAWISMEDMQWLLTQGGEAVTSNELRLPPSAAPLPRRRTAA